jgi:AraC-like DNA-binding protein
MAQAREHPVLSRLLVTDCGCFPVAAQHYRSRPRGIAEAVVIVCAEGLGFVDLGRGRRVVGPGQAVVIPPELGHAYGAHPQTPWTIWWMHLIGDDLPGLVAAVLDQGSEPIVRVNNPDKVVDLVAEALGHMERADTDLELMGAAGAAWHAMTVLSSDRLSKDHGDPVQSTVRFMQEHVGRRHSVAELSARANLSPSHFAALFRRSTGMSVMQYQIRLSMNKARELLDATDLPVASIASRVGYGDPFYFSRHFRAIHGLTPTQFRGRSTG